MEDIYNDLENYDDVNLVNELRTENSELKHKLVECTSSMEKLQKSILQDFDKVSDEFKTLEMNYSSLLKIARAEIKRKTDMITNLNIEKDMLIIKATQSAPPSTVHRLIKNVGTEAQRKKKKKSKGKGKKEKDEFVRKQSESVPSETSSTVTDNTNKMLSKDCISDNMKSVSRIVTKENELHKTEVFPDHRGDDNRSPVRGVDRRLSALARHQFSKLSSDEEFENMYSALEPKTSHREPERSRKRGRDKSQDARTYTASNLHDKSSSYPDPFRERFVKNRTSRFSDCDRNTNRDKPYNERQFKDNDRILKERDKFDAHYRKYSPERHRRGMREYGDERYSQYDRYRRPESPPRERHRHKSREHRPHQDREKEDQKQDSRYNYPDTHKVRHRVHDEYDEPQNKRQRVEQYSDHHDDRRQTEKQYYKDIHPTDVRERTCQSPDFSHTENESSNEPIPVIRSTALTALDDPRVTSKKYIKTMEGDKEFLHTANTPETCLQLVNKSLWNLQVVELPRALRPKALEISEEHVNEMDIEKPVSVLSMESGELGSETTDTFLDDFSDYREANEGTGANYKCVPSKKHNLKIEIKKEKAKSPINKTSEDNKNDVVQKELKSTRHKLIKLETAGNSVRADPAHTSCNASNKLSTSTQSDKTEKSTILDELRHSSSNVKNSPDLEKLGKSRSGEGKEHIPDLKATNMPEMETETSVSIFRDFEHRVFSTRHIVEGDLELSDESNDETHIQVKHDEKVPEKKKVKTRRKSHRDTSKEKTSDLDDTIRKTRSKKEKELKSHSKFSELFGDSSSLITPDELNLATKEAQSLPADCCPSLCEDAQDGINQSLKPAENVQGNISVSIENKSAFVNVEDEHKTNKDNKHRIHLKKHKDKEGASNDTDKDSKEILNEATQQKSDSVENRLATQVKLVFSSEKLKKMQNAKLNTDGNKSDSIKTNEKCKESAKSNKRTKSKHEKRLSSSESIEGNNGKRTYTSLETNSSKASAVGDNKENASCNDNSEKNISSEMARMFDDTNDSSEIKSACSTKDNEENLHLNEKAKGPNSNTPVIDIPNLAPVTDEPGLVKTVVISTGKPLDSDNVQYTMPLNAMAASTPAKEISIKNTSDIKSKVNHTACVNVTIASEDSVSQSETDAPDIRINYYKRRRKVLKK